MKELNFETYKVIQMDELCRYIQKKYNEDYYDLFEYGVGYVYYKVNEYLNDPDDFEERDIKFAERMKEIIGEEEIIILQFRG